MEKCLRYQLCWFSIGQCLPFGQSVSKQPDPQLSHRSLLDWLKPPEFTVSFCLDSHRFEWKYWIEIRIERHCVDSQEYFCSTHLILNSDSCQRAWSFHIQLLMQKIMRNGFAKAFSWLDPHYLLDNLASISQHLALFNQLTVFFFRVHCQACWHVLYTKDSKLVWMIQSDCHLCELR